MRKNSRTKELADAFFKGLDPSYDVEHLRLNEIDLPCLNEKRLLEREQLIESGKFDDDRFVHARKFAKADLIVVAAPFWDWSFPSMLKVYFENVCVEKITFETSVEGLKGRCCSKMVYLTTRGGRIEDGSIEEQAIPYIKAICRFLGVEYVSCVSSIGLDLYGVDWRSVLEVSKEKAYQLAKGL